MMLYASEQEGVSLPLGYLNSNLGYNTLYGLKVGENSNCLMAK